MIDLRIRGGLVVDGTGAPARRDDVAVRDGRIVPDDGSDAATTIDADGRIVAPGFVDIHTHYDAQVFWDHALTPSTLHGVTTAVSGNCGFTLSPVEPGDREYVTRMLANVEGIPREAIEAAVPWTWRTTGELLDDLERRGVGPNLAFLAGHSTIRRSVMGPRAIGEQATGDEIAAMQGLLRQSLAGGAIGLGTSWQANHTDGDHDPVPSRWATAAEIEAMCSIVRGYPGTTLEFAPPLERAAFSAEIESLMVAMSRCRGPSAQLEHPRVVRDRAGPPGRAPRDVGARRRRGACVVALFLPDVFRLVYDFRLGFRLEALPGWADLFKLSEAERVRALADSGRRAQLEEGAASDPFNPRFASWDDWTIAKTTAPQQAGLEGRVVGDIARERGTSSFDALLDIVVADELGTGISPPTELDNASGWAIRAQLATSPWTILGGSDAGAHVAFMCQATYPTRILREFTARDLLPVEEIVRQLTDVPARYYGLRDRGRLEPGCHADVVVLDLEAVVPGPLETRRDLPRGGRRVFAEARGVDAVIVNGTVLIDHGAPTGAAPGTVLRSGRDTTTVDNAAALAARRS